MSGCPEPLEKFFLQVEEESERRAEAEHRRTAELDRLVEEANAKKAKTRRRGSISISRLGQYTLDDALKEKSPPPTPSGFSSIASSSPFYRSQIANASTSSVASGASAFSNNSAAHAEDLSQVMQVHQIPPKTSTITRMIPRRLSRARSSSVIPSNDGAVIGIGVSVQETTVHRTVSSIEEEAELDTPSRRASVQAAHSLKNQSSKSTIGGTPPTNVTWVAKAREFTQKFRRKAKPAEPSQDC